MFVKGREVVQQEAWKIRDEKENLYVKKETTMELTKNKKMY